MEAQLTKREEFEFINLLTCALLTTQSAMVREESRGGHFRNDFPERDELIWKKHLLHHRVKGLMEEAIDE